MTWGEGGGLKVLFGLDERWHWLFDTITLLIMKEAQMQLVVMTLSLEVKE